jgi:multimeric flavodoxin WrbA
MSPHFTRPQVLALNGSERPHGNTSEVLEYVRGLLDSCGIDLVVVQLSQLNIRPCGPCGNCNVRSLPCSVDDDIAGLVAQMARADGIIYATPVHGFGMPALMQTVIERAGVGYLRFRRPLANKVAGVIVVGRRYSHDEVVAQIHHNVLLNRMILVGSGFPAILKTEGRNSALEDLEGLSALNAMIERMAEMIRLLRSYQQAFGESLMVSTLNERVR